MNKSCGVTSTKTDMEIMNAKTNEPTTANILARLISKRNKMNTGMRRIPAPIDEAMILAATSRPEVE
jgi:hypothetical protein